jgi:hypothetical protein
MTIIQALNDWCCRLQYDFQIYLDFHLNLVLFHFESKKFVNSLQRNFIEITVVIMIFENVLF